MFNTGRNSSHDVAQILADSVARLTEQMVAMEARSPTPPPPPARNHIGTSRAAAAHGERGQPFNAATPPARRGLEAEAFPPRLGRPFMPNPYLEFQDQGRDPRRDYYDEEDYEDEWAAAPNQAYQQRRQREPESRSKFRPLKASVIQMCT